MGHVMKHYIGKNLSLEDVKYAAKHQTQIAAQATILDTNANGVPNQFDPDDVKEREFKKLKKSPFADISAKMKVVQFECIRDALRLLDFDGQLNQSGQFFPIEKFIRHESEMLALTKKSKEDSCRRDRPNEEAFKFPGQKAIPV